MKKVDVIKKYLSSFEKVGCDDVLYILSKQVIITITITITIQIAPFAEQLSVIIAYVYLYLVILTLWLIVKLVFNIIKKIFRVKA